jgi:catechol 2,3-dioxygenase
MTRCLISQLAHVEFTSPKPEETVNFLIDVLGMEESHRAGQSTYLRCWGEYFHHSIIVTEGAEPSLAHVGWRAGGSEELELAVARLEQAGNGEGWLEDSIGHGRAYRYRSPGGHLHEIFWDVERWSAPAELRSGYPNRPQKFTGRGAAVRQIDHLTVPTGDIMVDVEWLRDTLGYRFTEWTAPDATPDVPVFAMMTTNEKAHDLGILGDHSGLPGRIHHVAFWLDGREDVLRAADILLEAGVKLEYGPGRHGMGEMVYLYFREPGGLRLELNSGGTRNYQPDWQPVLHLPSQGSNDYYRNAPLPDSFLEAFPSPGVPAFAGAEDTNPWQYTSVS